MTLKIVIAGYGVMGQSYVKNFERVQEVAKRDYGLDIEISAIADKDAQKMTLIDAAGYPAYDDYQNAINHTKPDLVINALNDSLHYDFFKFIEQSDVKGVISEKPFTETLDEAVALKSCFDDRFLSLNLVENYSEIIPIYETEMARQYTDGLKLIGIEGVWGKDRTQDTRPTQGIISDMIHPMGLFMRIFDVDNFKTLRSKAVQGPLMQKCDNPDVRQKDVKFENHVAMVTGNGTPVRLDCSYAWRKQEDSPMKNAQDRRITGYYSAGEDSNIRAVEFTFDSPFGGSDTVRIYDINTENGEAALLAERTALNHTLNGTVLNPHADQTKGGKAKLARFMLDSIVSFAKPNLTSSFGGRRVIGYDAAVETQTFLQEIDNHEKYGYTVTTADPLNDYDTGFARTTVLKPVANSDDRNVLTRVKTLKALKELNELRDEVLEALNTPPTHSHRY